MKKASSLARAFRRMPPILACAGLVSCHAAPLRIAAVDEMDRVRQSAGAREGARLAPEVYAGAEQERVLALRAHAAGDDVGATLHAERAGAAYSRALAVARLGQRHHRAGRRDQGPGRGDGAGANPRSLARRHATPGRRARAACARRSRSHDTGCERGCGRRARRGTHGIAARSLAMQARLLCGAARLVASAAPDLPNADQQVERLEERLARAARATSTTQPQPACGVSTC